MRHLILIPAVSFLCLLLTACVGLDGLGVPGNGTFDPVDEDFDRLRPTIAPEGALQMACEAEDPTPLLQTSERVFAHALCLCGDLEDVGSGLVTESDSYLLSGDTGRGHVGINGNIASVGNLNVDGTLDVANGLQGVGNVSIGADLLSGANVEITGSWNVGRDAWVDGDVSGVGSIEIERDLYLTGDLRAVGSVEYATGHRGFDYGSQPCPCSASQVIDVPAEVAAHRSDNDNALLPEVIGNTHIVLESGAYYFSGESSLVGSAGITVRGHAQVYIDGDIESVGNLQIAVEPGGELELWVAGTVRSVGNLQLSAGDERPRAFKLYMGGDGNALMNVGNALFVGGIYAPNVDIEYVGNLQVRGSLFANNLRGTGNLEVFYDTDMTTPRPCAQKKYKL